MKLSKHNKDTPTQDTFLKANIGKTMHSVTVPTDQQY